MVEAVDMNSHSSESEIEPIFLINKNVIIHGQKYRCFKARKLIVV